MLKKIVAYFKGRNWEYEYLADSKDLVDLERRQRQITRGEASFQITNNFKAKGFYQ